MNANSAHQDTFTRDKLPEKSQWPVLDLTAAGLDYGEYLNVTTALLDEHVAAGYGDQPVIHSAAGTWSYGQLQKQVDRICAVLRDDMGLIPGNRVLLRGANNPMMAASLLATFKCGLVAVPTMPLLRASELSIIIEKAHISAALCDQSLLSEMELAAKQQPILKQIIAFNDPAAGPDSLESLGADKSSEAPACKTAADDPVLIAFTSGTTGKPKGTVHFHRDVLAMCDLFPRHVLKPKPTDVFTGTPPLAFTFGLGGMLCFPMRAGASTLLIEKTDPRGLLELIDNHQVTTCFTAPTFYRQMASAANEFSLVSLKQCVSAGEALPVATRDAFEQATGIQIIDGIGATEMIHIFISSPPETARRGAIGQVVPGYEARIVDEQMNTLPVGEVGRLAVRGPTGCRYLDDDRQLNYVKDGWNLTGDTFRMDGDRYFFYQARSDDMIVSAGYNIAGPEVEDTLLAHEAVAECGVVGIQDDERGQVVKATVVLKPGFERGPELVKTLQDWVKSRIAPYKYPRVVEFADTLPRTETGKLQRFRLRTP
ncbi:MAG: AMP-binding protein [Burkholderiaceae bacterium]